MNEVGEVSSLKYPLQNALLYVLLGLPNHIYEFMPIAVLIGTIYVLAQFASNSEFTIMRAASMSTFMAGSILAKIGLGFVVFTFVFGELIGPYSSKLAQKVKMSSMSSSVTQEFRSGLWTKDLLRENGLSGKVIGSLILNAQQVLPDRSLLNVKVFEFDNDFHLTKEITAAKAEYTGENLWRLSDVTETAFPKNLSLKEATSFGSLKSATKQVTSEITPDILAVLLIDPDRMSAYDLAAYTEHLSNNKQDAKRYEIAFWKKITYPFAILVMMALALPFAYLHARSGGVSLKIFSGIMIGMVFYLFNSLFSHIGMLNTWPAFSTALAPSVLFMLIALAALRYVERH